MATGNTNITINFNIGGDFSEKIDKYVRKINTAQKVVAALRDSLEALASSGAKGFDSANITKSLESVKNVFSSFKNIKGDDLRKSIEALDPTRLREFSGALTGFQGALTNDLVGRISAFATSLQGLSAAQKAMDSNTFVEKLNAISEALPKLQSAVKSENFKTFAGSLSGLNVDAQSIQGIIKLGQALKSITEFGNKGTSLNELATGIKSLGRIRETSGFTRNVENIVKAGALLAKMEPIDFSKITGGLSQLTQVNLKKDEWDKVKAVAGQIKEAFADLKSVKIPNLLGFQMGVEALNNGMASLDDPRGLKTNVAEIKAALDQLSTVKMPNLGNLVKNLGKLSEENYDFDKIGKSVQSFKNTLGQLHGIQIPSLSGFAKGLVELKGVSGTEIQNIANALKGVPESLAGWDKVKTPNLTSFAKGLKELGSGTIDFKQVNENLKSLPNRLKKLGEIQAPDLSKFAKGLVDLSQPAVSAVKSAHAIDKALEVLTKYSSTQIKLPSLSNFAKGLRELATFEGELTTLQGKSTLIKNFISGFSDLDKIKLPNIQGVATAIHKLSTAVPDNAGTLAAGHIGAIVENVKKLDNVKLPNIRQIGQAVTELAAISNHKYGTAEGGLIRLVYRIKELDSVKLPNIRQIGQTMTELAAISSHKYGVAEGGLIQLVNRIKDLNNIKIANIRQIGQTMTELAAISSHKYGVAEGGLIQMVNRLKDLNGIKLPNIRQIGQTMTELAAISSHKYGVAEGGLIQLIARLKELDGVHLTNVRQVGQSMTELSKISNHKYGTVESGLIGFVTRIKELDKVKIPNVRQIGQALTELAEISNKHKFHKINTNIAGFIAELKKLDSVRLPNIRQIGLTMTELAAISSHKYGVAEGGLIQLIARLKELSSINIPNIRQIGLTMTELAAISSHKYGVAESGLIGFVTRIKELDKVNIPNVRQIGQALTELNAVASKHKFNTLNAQLPKFITEISRLHSIQLPNVKQIGQGVAELAKLSNHKFGTVEQGLIKVIDRLKDLNGVQLPNVKQIGQALQMFNEYSSNATIAASKLGILRTELSQWTNIKLPNVKNVAEGLKTLNDTTIKYKFDSNAKYVSQIKVVADEIKTAFAGFNNIQLPNVKNVADGFRILNELTIKPNNAGHTNLTANIHKLKQALSQLKDLDGTAFPNVKNISEGMQNLTKLGPIAQDLNGIFQTVANALQHVNGIKVPKLKDFTDGFAQLKTIVSQSTGTMETSKFAQDMTALSTALSGFGKVSLPPNLSGFAKGIEAITKVNVGLFSRQFNELMVAINSFKIDTNNAALNHFTAVLTLAASAIQQINGKLGQAQSQFGSFGRSVDQVINPMDKLVERFKMFMQYRVISTVFSSITNQLRNVPSAITEFEKGMYNIQSITGTTNESMSKLGDVIKYVAGNTKFSVQEIADGMTTIAQAGFTAGQSMQMIQSISNLATGTLSDMKTTVDLATSAMVVFGIESHQAARVSDVFANAVNKSKLNMDKIKTAFNYIGPVARDANISFEETAVAMMMLANNGQKASTIGTGLRNVFSTLLSPSKKLEAAANAAGVALADLDPRANSLRDVLSRLGVVVKDSQVALEVFGKRGATAVLGLTQSMGEYDRLYDAVGKVGTAAQMAAKQQEGLYVQWKNLKDRAQLAAVSIGEAGLTDAISVCVRAFSNLLNSFNLFVQNNKYWATFGVVSASVVAATVSVVGLSKAIMSLGKTAIVMELAGAFKILNARLATSLGLLTSEAAAARAAAAATGTATVATRGFGAALWAVAKSPLFLVITAAVTTVSAGLALWRKHTERFEEALKRVGQEVDALGGSARAYTDFSQATIELKEGTDEYYNAMQRLLVSLKENKEATALAGKEYYNLLASVDTTKKSFTDGGKALQAYIDRLRELENVKVDEQLKLLGERLKQSDSFMDRYGRREVKSTSYVSVDQWGGQAETNEYFDASWQAMKRLNEEIAIGKIALTDAAKKFQEEFAEIQDKVQGFLNLKLGTGLLDVNSTLLEVEELARKAGHEGTILNAILEEFMEKQKVVNEGIFRMNEAFADSYKNIDNFAELDKYLLQASEAVQAMTKTDLDLSGIDKAVESIYKEAEAAGEASEAYKRLQNTYKNLREVQEEYSTALLHEDWEKAAELLKKMQIHEKDYVEVKRQSTEQAKKFLETQTELASKVAGDELAILIRRLANEFALHEKHTKAIEGQHQERLDSLQNKLKKGEITNEQYQARRKASLQLHNAQIEKEEARHAEAVEKLKANPISADQYLENTLKAYKEYNDRISVTLQEELNSIHKREDAYIKSNKEIGLSFEDARRAEQNAIAKAAAARIKDLEDRKKKMIEMYGAVDAAEQVEKIEQEIKKVQEDSLKKQHELKEKYAKLGAMLIAQRAKEVEAAAKKETEARKRAQEQALHDVAILEAKGVKSHEEAEREKTEITLKYIEEETKAKQAQIEALSSSDEARVENIDQIQRLKDDIQKNTDEIVKIRRKGIEDQTKIIREGTEKLRELQGSYNKAGAEAQLGDFSTKQQAKITQNYKEQLQRRKELGEENAKELESVQRESLSKVAQEIQRHCAKREDIQAKTTEKIASLEKDLAQKQEDFEKKKLDIIKKYNAKRRDLQTSLQDKLHNIETSGLSGKKKEKADIDYARSKRNRAMSGMDEAISSGDSQALDRISKELESAMGAFEGASKPKKYLGEIMDIYNALQKIIDAQEQIEKQEAERKNTQEVDAIQTKINSAMEAMQKSVAVEEERHTKAMTNLENEADKIKKQIELAEQLVKVYTDSANQQTVFDQQPPVAQQGQKPAGRRAPESSIPAQEGTFDKGVQDEIAKGQAAAEAISEAFTEATTAVQGAATQMAEGVVSAAGTAAEGVKTTVNNASTDFGLISKTIADTMSDGVRGTTEGMDMAQKTMMAAAKTGLNTYQKEVEGTVVTVATNMSQAQIEAFQAAAPAMKAMAKRGMEEIAEDAGKTPIDLQFKTNAELVAQMAVDEVLAAKDKADSTLEAEPLVFAASVDKESPVTDAIQLAEDVSKRMSEIFEGQPPIVTPDVDTRGLEEMAQKANDTVQTISAKEPIDLTVQASEEAIQGTEERIDTLKERIVAEAAKLGVELNGDSVDEVKSAAERLISDIDNRRVKVKPELNQDDVEGVKYQIEKLLKDLEGQEGILLQVQADKSSIDEVHSVLNKLAKDISEKEQILLKPEVDESEKRKVLSEIADLYKEAQSKIEAIKLTAQSDEVKQEIAKVEAMLKSMTKEVTTKLKVDTNSAIQAINNHINMLNKIPKEKVTVIKTVYKTEGKKAEASTGGYIEHLIPEYNKGGRVRRPEEEPEQYADGGQTFRRLPSRYINRGSGHKDDVPALLMKNEFVHRAAAVKKYGLNFMYKLNNLEIPASITRMFADGGLVSNAVTSIQKFATGGLVKSAKRKLEDMFSGSGVNLNVDNLNVVGKIEQAADSITSPIGVQALHTIAKSIEANVARFAEGGPLTSTVLTSRQMSEISGKYHTIIAQARQEGNTAIAKALSEEQANLAKLASALKGNLDNINITYNKQVQKLTEAHNKRVSEKEAEYKNNVNSENESYGKRVDSDNKAYAKEDEEYNKSIAQLKSDYEKELEELEKALKDKKEAARKEEEREAKEEAKTQKSYEKEDKRYAKETADRKKSHDDELVAAKKEYEDAQFKYEAELEQKKQEVDAKKSEIENFKNQMASRKFPANSKKIREASVEEVMEAHIAQTKSENKGDDYIYAIDLGGLVKAEDNKGEPPTDAEIQKLYKAIRPYTESEIRHRNKLATIANNPPYSRQAREQLEKYNNDLNELTGYNAYKRALKAKELGVSIANIENADKEPSKPRQSKPYREYLNSHYTTDYKQPYAQAQRDLDEFLKADSPKTTYNKRVAELKQAYDEAKKEAEEARAEVMEQRKEHAEQLAETRASRAEELRQAQIDYDEGVAATKEKYNTDLSEAEENRRVLLEERKTAIAERDKEHKDNLDGYKKDYDDTVSEATASYNEDMASAKESYDSDVSSARSQYSSDVASLREDTQNSVNSAKESMNDSISRAQADMQEDFKSQEDAARQALAEKRDTYSTTMKEAEEALVDSIERPSTTVAAQESVEKATEQISENAVLQKYGMGVEELIRRLSKGLWKFATGGLVPSTATSKPNTDSVLSLLMPNEFVMSAKAVRTFGLDFMNSINNLRLPAFAIGGAVSAGGSAPPEIRSFKAGEMAVNKTVYALDLTLNNTHIGELMGERNVIDRFIGEMQRARMSLGATV